MATYISQLTPMEQKVLKIAASHLETSFSLVKSIGFQEWQQAQQAQAQQIQAQQIQAQQIQAQQIQAQQIQAQQIQAQQTQAPAQQTQPPPPNKIKIKKKLTLPRV